MDEKLVTEKVLKSLLKTGKNDQSTSAHDGKSC
jgi:hypothetical protein